MKLLHKVVKSSQSVNIDGCVSIDNTVLIKPKFTDKNHEADSTNEETKSYLKACEQNLLNSYEKKLADLEDEKAKILSEATVKANQIINEAQTQAVVLKEQARKSGHSEGYEAGFNDAYKNLEGSLIAVTTFIEQLNKEREALYIKNENDIIDTAYEMARKITLSEIKTDKDIIFGIVKQACKNFRNSDYVKISLAKCDFSQTVVTDEKLIKKIAGNIPDIEIELLQDAKSGTVILDNDSEIIDASVTTQLDFLKEVLNAGKRISE